MVCVILPLADWCTPVDPAHSDGFPDLCTIILATRYVKVSLLSEGCAQRLHGLWWDLNHQSV